MKRPLRIVVAGFFVGFPLGGQAWMILHYLLGLSRLGHEVLFLEDASDWAYPFDPAVGHGVDDSRHGRAVLEAMLARHGLSGRYFYRSDIEGATWGVSRDEAHRFCAASDLFLNVSGVIPLRDEYLAPRVRAFIDTDPIFTQVKIARDPGMRDYVLAHQFHFTYGLNIPSGTVPDVPLSGLDWKPLTPPVVLDLWAGAPGTGRGYTTIGTWDARDRDMEIGGRRLSWRKSVKYEAMIDLPSRLPGVDLELTMSGMKEAGPRFAQAGWIVRDALAVSADPEVYRDYILSSRAHFSLAKDQNVILKSGWFSDRSAAYLAAGKPVIDEDTGFKTVLPTGEGLFAFEGMEAAMAAIRAVEADPARHGRAARKIAEEHFDAAKVLSGLLTAVGLG
ncbi:hypothetical protein [Desulfolutivibrio sulfoxidireducens]|uniref:hypothetical protein n=1 Tax=Desulfolutivibrio sulfoxidireducens TaxID=2773299 RepID=UPI00159E19AD|nr:hypothetical protein [Desulfolutivibrio sulfoxidireducens]QLA17166.1 hypothetical protein GD605_14255 [Desulfolutivibrio sulfoxidireducens]